MNDANPEKKLLDLITKTQGRSRLKKQLKIFTKINSILIALVIVILAAILVDMFTFNYESSEFDIDLPDEEILPVSENFDVELDEDIEVIDRGSSIPKEELLKNFLLMGIVTGENNQAIIEDKSAKKTLFLYKGDSLGEFTVHDIKDSSVILDYKGEKVELKI